VLSIACPGLHQAILNDELDDPPLPALASASVKGVQDNNLLF
jgi:hypothetical protein